MGTLVNIGEFRLGWKVPSPKKIVSRNRRDLSKNLSHTNLISSQKKCVAKSERFIQKSLAHHPISTFPLAARNSTVTKGDRYSSLAHKDTHTHMKGVSDEHQRTA